MDTTTGKIQNWMEIDGQPISFTNERSVLEVARNAGIDIPSFCYHSELSAHGACRLCMVEIPGKGIKASCTLAPEQGLSVKTNSEAVRAVRKVALELLLANHDMNCPTCPRTGACRLQELARRLGIDHVRYHRITEHRPLDLSNSAIARNPNRCILCGDCVKACHEIQSVGAIDIAFRGGNSRVTPAFGRSLSESDCVYCGQCVRVCPTGALTPRSQVNDVWRALNDPDTFVIAQIAPAVRVALGELFHLKPGPTMTWRIVSALRRMGFDRVFDTNFTADLTIVEEATEFLQRFKRGERLPLLTSCSPGWVNFLERFYPELIPYASSCRSPMSMMSSLIKTYYAEISGIDPKDIFVVSIMPCTAKKFESRRPELSMPDGTPQTDAVLTTRELIYMIKSYGLDLSNLPDGEFDSPLGESTGAADIFGTTGGVLEAALRMAAEVINGRPPEKMEFTEVRAVEGLRVRDLKVNDELTLRVGVANGLQNAKKLLDKVVNGEETFHIIEVMACPGGCIGGGGQPYPPKGYTILDPKLLAKRASALYAIDSNKPLRSSNHNPAIQRLYREYLGEPGGEKAHALLHTHYAPRLPRGIR